MADAVFVGAEVHDLKEVGSTNIHAAGLLSSNTRPKEGTVILAQKQTRGRGQFGRTWLARAGSSLAMSLILYPRFLQASHSFRLSIAVALGVRHGIQSLDQEVDVKLKWPNDIFMADRKIGGILIENTLSGKTLQSSIAGIGINLRLVASSETLPQAGNLLELTGREVDFYELAAAICRGIEARYLRLRAGDPSNSLRREYLEALYRYGEVSRFKVGDRTFEGIISGVEESGELAVQVGNSLNRFQFGEIEMII